MKPKRQSPERDLQRALCRHFDVMFGPQVFWTTFPAGGGGKMRGWILKRSGLKTGVPDVLIVYQGKAHWLELKAGKNDLSDAQYDTQTALKFAGSETVTVRTLAEAFRAIDRWGIPSRLARAA